jgi:protein TonB
MTLILNTPTPRAGPSYQGSVLLWLVVAPNGRPRNIRVQRSLGMGLDEKAIEAVSQWRFQPATLNGQLPVAVQMTQVGH